MHPHLRWLRHCAVVRLLRWRHTLTLLLFVSGNGLWEGGIFTRRYVTRLRAQWRHAIVAVRMLAQGLCWVGPTSVRAPVNTHKLLCNLILSMASVWFHSIKKFLLTFISVLYWIWLNTILTISSIVVVLKWRNLHLLKAKRGSEGVSTWKAFPLPFKKLRKPKSLQKSKSPIIMHQNSVLCANIIQQLTQTVSCKVR